jgi:hypothetical protein
MLCNDVRTRIDAGEPLDADLLSHLTSCSSCGQEFAFLTALRASTPTPSPELRTRVLAGRPRHFRSFAIAAAILLAAALGFVGGHFARPAPEVKVVPVQTARTPTEEEDRRQLSVIGYGLKGLYHNAVEVSFNGNQVTHIQATNELERRNPTCPVLKEARKFSERRPDLIAWR